MSRSETTMSDPYVDLFSAAKRALAECTGDESLKYPTYEMTYEAHRDLVRAVEAAQENLKRTTRTVSASGGSIKTLSEAHKEALDKGESVIVVSALTLAAWEREWAVAKGETEALRREVAYEIRRLERAIVPFPGELLKRRPTDQEDPPCAASR